MANGNVYTNRRKQAIKTVRANLKKKEDQTKDPRGAWGLNVTRQKTIEKVRDNLAVDKAEDELMAQTHAKFKARYDARQAAKAQETPSKSEVAPTPQKKGFMDRVKSIVKRKISEAVEPLPKKRGYVNYSKIDGHDVHVRFLGRKGKYRPHVTVNGSVHKEGDHSPETNRKIVHFVSSSMKEFMDTKKPTKLRIQANSPKKAAVYKAYAHSDKVAKQGYAAKDKGSMGVVLHNPANKSFQSPVPKVDYNPSNPAHAPMSSSRGKKGFKADWKGGKTKWDAFMKKKKWNAKGDKLAAKGSVKAAKAAKA